MDYLGYSVWEMEQQTINAIGDYIAEHNPEAIVRWVEGCLLSGKHLVIPPALYDRVIAECQAAGMKQEALANIHKSINLTSTTPSKKVARGKKTK